jgi:hypothetical protein
MTELKSESPTIRQTGALERTRPIVVELWPRYLTIRLKGLRSGYNVDYGAILDLGRKRAWLRKRAEKRKREA